MCAARARKLYDERAKERQKESGGDRKSTRAKSVVANLPEPISAGRARDEVGKAFGVSGRSVDYATKVINTAIPDVVKVSRRPVPTKSDANVPGSGAAGRAECMRGAMRVQRKSATADVTGAQSSRW